MFADKGHSDLIYKYVGETVFEPSLDLSLFVSGASSLLANMGLLALVAAALI